MGRDSACLDLFMSRASKFDLLTPDQEISLGKKVQAMMKLKASGKSESELNFQERKIWKSGLRAREQMIQANLKLVVHVAGKISQAVNARSGTSGMEKMDLIQEGNIGLATAVDKYSPEKGYRFCTYAYWWIKQAISRGIQNQERTIRIPDHAHEAIRKAMKAEAKIMNETGNSPKVSEIAKAINIERSKLEEYLISARRTKSLEGRARKSDSDYTSLAEIVADTRESCCPSIKLDTSQLDRALSLLDPRDKVIVCMRYGLPDGEVSTLLEIAEQFNLSRERIRQICEKSIRIMRLKMYMARNSPIALY
jgi:RNA polymerase primary sigma factor